MFSKKIVTQLSPVIFMALFFIVTTAFAETVDEAYDKAEKYLKQGNYDEAITEFNNAFDGTWKDAWTYGDRGNVYLHKGNYDQAISDCNRAIELLPDYGFAYYYRAYAYYYKQEYNKAWSDMYKAESLGVHIDPDFLEALKKASGREN